MQADCDVLVERVCCDCWTHKGLLQVFNQLTANKLKGPTREVIVVLWDFISTPAFIKARCKKSSIIQLKTRIKVCYKNLVIV